MCKCSKWFENIGKQVSVEVMSEIHGAPYSGEKWAFCPWCGSRLTPLALDAAFTPPAEHVQNSDIIPAGKSDSQPRQ